jgi:AcrR family transcriptional regulator
VANSSPGQSTSEILIAATARRLWDEDESELRILDICQETKLSTSVIYGHFRSRQGLIDASLLDIYRSVANSMLEQLTLAAEAAKTSNSFVDVLYAMLTDPEREATVTRQRQMHLRISATALSRPSIRRRFLEIYQEFKGRMIALYSGLVDQGLLSDELTGAQWALFFEGQMLSRAFHDLTSLWDNQDDWLAAARRIINVPDKSN